MKITFNIFTAAAVLLAAGTASATSRPLPFTYPNETLGEGQVEIEMYADVNPVRVDADPADPSAGAIWEPAYVLQTEIEYGVSDRVELGFYQVFKAEPGAGGGNGLEFDGLKWRVRTRFAEPGELPVDIGLYLELETMHDELAIEPKLNLQRRVGPLRFMSNLWVEGVLERPLEKKSQGMKPLFLINPTAGFAYEVTPVFQPGIEYWARGQVVPTGDGQDRTNSAVHHFVGPTSHLNYGRLWWSIGFYANLNHFATPVVGDAYGPVWMRSTIALQFY